MIDSKFNADYPEPQDDGFPPMPQNYVPIESDEVCLGMTVFCAELYPGGTVLTAGGRVVALGYTEHGQYFAQLQGTPYTGHVPRYPIAVKLFRVDHEPEVDWKALADKLVERGI